MHSENVRDFTAVTNGYESYNYLFAMVGNDASNMETYTVLVVLVIIPVGFDKWLTNVIVEITCRI